MARSLVAGNSAGASAAWLQVVEADFSKGGLEEPLCVPAYEYSEYVLHLTKQSGGGLRNTRKRKKNESCYNTKQLGNAEG